MNDGRSGHEEPAPLQGEAGDVEPELLELAADADAPGVLQMDGERSSGDESRFESRLFFLSLILRTCNDRRQESRRKKKKKKKKKKKEKERTIAS